MLVNFSLFSGLNEWFFPLEASPKKDIATITWFRGLMKNDTCKLSLSQIFLHPHFYCIKKKIPCYTCMLPYTTWSHPPRINFDLSKESRHLSLYPTNGLTMYVCQHRSVYLTNGLYVWVLITVQFFNAAWTQKRTPIGSFLALPPYHTHRDVLCVSVSRWYKFYRITQHYADSQQFCLLLFSNIAHTRYIKDMEKSVI